MKIDIRKATMIATVIFAVGVLAGWLWRDKVAADTCVEMGGGWSSPGLCYDATRYLLE